MVSSKISVSAILCLLSGFIIIEYHIVIAVETPHKRGRGNARYCTEYRRINWLFTNYCQ